MKKTKEKINTKRVFGAKWLTVAMALVLILTVTVGVTVALLVWRSDKESSLFKPALADCEVVENDGTFYVRNCGDTDVYVRAMFTVTFKNADGEIYAKKQPKAGVDYEIELDLDKWFLGSDGYYYCKAPVATNGDTDALIKSFSVISVETAVAGSEDENVFFDEYTLSVDMIASAIQSEPSEAVKDYWNVRVDGDGYLRK